MVNAPGSWNFSELNVRDPMQAEDFYGAVFGWLANPFSMNPDQEGWMWRVVGYGEFLAERDPEIRSRQESAEAPDGFADVVALMNPLSTDSVDAVHWSVTFGVADADAALDRATQLGASVVTPLFDTQYTRMATVQDPQGAVLSLSQYRPPEAS